MKRDWKIIRAILEHIEAEDLREYAEKYSYVKDLNINEDDFLGHIEILADAGIIRNAEVVRTVNGTVSFCNLNGVFITMQGHDLLDALRDSTVWSRIKEKAVRAGVSISWEFIKAAIPAVMKELCR
nr:MAG TPA: YjcQ protein [Caudoviricetes sp.]